MVTVYTLTYNEELLIQFMIDHYRERFPGCWIVVNDNMSTDSTVNIARKNGCDVIIDTKPRKLDEPLTKIKNSCWKDANTDWVLVCDLDELLDISEAQLKAEEKMGTTIIRSEGYNMVAMDENLDITGMKYGARDVGHDKNYLFNKKYISDINYSPGAHVSYPIGTAVYSKKIYKLYHYCYPQYAVTVKKYKLITSRMTAEDIKNYGFYSETPEEIRALYTQARREAVKVR